MAEKLEDFNLASSIIQRLVKDTISENFNVSKDARTALSRAASVFILYVTSHACDIAQKANRKSLLGQDVLDALENLEFDYMVEPLQVFLKDLRKSVKEKKEKGAKVKSNKPINDNETENISDHDISNID